MYLKEERIEEFKCDLCKRTGKVTKKTDIVKFPPLLIIHLSRFYAVPYSLHSCDAFGYCV